MEYSLDQHDAGCGCCGAYATDALLNELSLMSLERRALDFSGLTRALREETGDAPYVDAEIELTSVLAENANDLSDDVEAPITEAMDRYGMDAGAIISAATVAAGIWSDRAWPTTTEAKVGIAIDGATLLGQHEIPFSPLISDTERLRIVSGMSASAKYYTNNYFNTQVMPSLVDAVSAAILNGTSNDLAELDAIRQMLDRRLRSVPYWNVVANSAASRAYHYGYIKTGAAMKKRQIRYRAILDARTSEICRHLNGMTWTANDVSLLADRIATAGPEEIKTITPWLKPDDVVGLDAAQLYSLGVTIPPVHGRCRSRLVWV